MIIITNCLSKVDDEGCLKVSSKIVLGMKALNPKAKLITYENMNPSSDLHIKLNKYAFNLRLMYLIRKDKEPVLYAPSYARMLQTAGRVFILSCFARKRLYVLLPMCPGAHRFGEWLIKVSRARLICFSLQTKTRLEQLFPRRVKYLKAAVDTERFLPVNEDRKSELRLKYGLPDNKIIVLHVGHMKSGRNIETLMELSDDIHVVLVVSTTSKEFRDVELERRIKARKNITVFDQYIPAIEELYQVANVYLFPVLRERQCIDVPLSAFEAAACNIPVVTTPYGEIRQVIESDGFSKLNDVDKETLNRLIRLAAKKASQPRQSVSKYDWKIAVEDLNNWMYEREV